MLSFSLKVAVFLIEELVLEIREKSNLIPADLSPALLAKPPSNCYKRVFEYILCERSFIRSMYIL